ncbi:5'-methylthioadenosine/S-adenosylhomocysteine nucleosidase [Salinispora tropica]|uniref:Purine or other phosphorylase, family 1 n=1 Tax=Salinispora tropica (strain ATCC BAA-916 / DSM 44818 / JCM 13857 / NBRC 105044 / CNB-440) TaxID=369723 RepID=A4XCZ2_SALTO|nr:5'-methylthioadenosine/S-adenosylhomocysteine nucleosidase [Salinispora tropica]ABP56799.1 purine or other phosphorylase, family 1 [Salinispora tropica CNB-440]
MNTNSGFVVILTALNLEYEAVRDQLADLRVRPHPAGTRFEVGKLGQSGCRVALGLAGKGNHPAAVIAERAIAQFSPTAMLFVGIAGGLWPTIRLGDVVVASKVYAYHGGTSEDDGLKARPKSWEIPHEADQIAHHLDRSGTWHRNLPTATAPRVHFGPIAAGEVVQDSGISDQARWIRQHYHDAMAIEMEGAGAAQAGHLNRALPVVVVRGISDHADGSKAAMDGQNWQPKAARHAAAFATALAEELITQSPHSRGDTDRDGSRTMQMTNSNLATGNAQVGFQAGQINGNITVGATPAQSTDDVAASIAELRTRLKQAHLDGQLDEETYVAAESELEAAAECVAAGIPEKKSGLVVALKRLRGLVADVSELAARLAAIIAVVRSMS